jgi:hypothetical protein
VSSCRARNTVARLLATRLRPVHEASVGTVDGIAYFTAVARKLPTWYDRAVKRSGEGE